MDAQCTGADGSDRWTPLSLFFDFVQVLGWIEELGEEFQVWTARVLENVIGDDEDISEMSDELGVQPSRVCAGGVSRVRRPRLSWSNVGLQQHERTRPCP